FTVLWGTFFPKLSEYFQGNEVTVNRYYYDRVAIPMGLFLLFLTGIGPVLAWRSSSFRSVRKNFILPVIAAVVTGIVVIAFGVQPWDIFTTTHQGGFYAFITYCLGALVVTAVASEFWRGARVIRRNTGKNLLMSAIQLTRRNTRRYGGYIVHFGVVLIFIGLSGQAFNQKQEMEMALHQKAHIGPYTVECESFSQDTNPNYDTEYAMLNVYRDGKLVTKMAPERRFYAASQQPLTVVSNHSTPAWDLYVVYAGKNPDTGQPIIQLFLNPLVMWIWIGVAVIAFGTVIALIPNMSAAAASKHARAPAEQPVLTTQGGD
ncbi:MAG: cytochrome c-type biogenesis CcmF C-terminal domain-containing protein, partial [Acidobacteriaceae bacterium]